LNPYSGQLFLLLIKLLEMSLLLFLKISVHKYDITLWNVPRTSKTYFCLPRSWLTRALTHGHENTTYMPICLISSKVPTDCERHYDRHNVLYFTGQMPLFHNFYILICKRSLSLPPPQNVCVLMERQPYAIKGQPTPLLNFSYISQHHLKLPNISSLLERGCYIYIYMV
jgi:hypothetical protein